MCDAPNARAFVHHVDGDCQYDGNGDNLWQLDCHNGSWASYNPVSGIVQPVDEVGCYVPGI